MTSPLRESTTAPHGLAKLLKRLDRIRALAFDRTLADDEMARRVRDVARVHDGEGDQ